MSGYLLVRVADVRYGLPLECVIEVVDSDQVFAVPGAHAAVRGVTAARGRLVTRIWLGGLAGDAVMPAAPAGTVAVVTASGRTLALEVDDAEGILRDDPLPAPPGWDVPLTQGVIRSGDALVPVLDLSGVVERLGAAAAGV